MVVKFLFALVLMTSAEAWTSIPHPSRRSTILQLSSASTESVASLKAELISACSRGNKPENIRSLVKNLMQVAEAQGQGQASSSSGFLSGEWELLYSTEDETRSSPFFWAFRKAIDNADQIYSVTDNIPAPLKEIGPARQNIEWVDTAQTGRFVSRVKVATLGGLATSIMTTRATITGTDGTDGIVLQIDTTKPERSTALSTLLGPFGDVLNENAPAFPSGQALEQIRPGSSKVIMRTGFCDEGLRISWDDARPDDIFVWRRNAFADYDFL